MKFKYIAILLLIGFYIYLKNNDFHVDINRRRNKVFLKSNDYVINRYNISELHKKSVKMFYLHIFMHANYSTHSDRMRVLKLWDRYRWWRFYIFIGSIKNDIVLFIRNII